MIDLTYFKAQFEQLQQEDPDAHFATLRQESFAEFNRAGLPTYRTEEWKYTGISSLFNHPYQQAGHTLTAVDIDSLRMPGHQQANELVFVNGRFDVSLSNIRSAETELTVLSLKDAANGTYGALVKKHLNNSKVYIQDGIHALNGAFITEGAFIYIHKNKVPKQPLYIYHILDSRAQPTLAQPRTLIYVAENSSLQLTETCKTVGESDSFCNAVMEVVVEQNAFVEYYKIQNDGANANQVSTTHITQIGKSYVHTVTVSLNGGIIRNNLNLILDAEGNETHLYGLYLLKGKTHADNHTLIDNRQPNCFSNQLYKGIVDDSATAVFNGRIMVQPDAQKTNSFQSNRNILLSDNATVNAKPQLEIFADDVKCSHGCTVGQLDAEALFYLRARGIPKEQAEVLLLQAYAADILAEIKPLAIRAHIEKLVHEHLSKV